MTKPRLVYRVYAFAAALSVAVMLALLILPRYTMGGRYLEPQAALMQHLVDRWSLKEPAKLNDSMKRIEPRLRGGLTLYSNDGRVVRTNVDPPLDPATDDERVNLAKNKWSLAFGRIVVRSDDSSLIGVYAPDRPGFPWGYVIPLGAGILIVVAGASLWFARRLARPLEQLASAARKFGAGDVTARADLHRNDEVGNVGKAFDEIDQLIADILTTARLDGEHARVEHRTVRLGELADRAAEKFVARHPHRVLEQAVAEGDRDLRCDPLLLRRALDNLLDNAAKYSEPTEPVRLAVTPNGTGVAFEIVDHGIGMSEDELQRAFTPFWRADGSRARTTGGVGLGLALARRIARAHGGDVTLQSSPGEGTTARLELPATSA